MAYRVLLSLYSLKVKNGANETALNIYNGKDDFFDETVRFVNYIVSNIQEFQIHRNKDKIKFYSKLEWTVDTESREIYGYITSGRKQELSIDDASTGETNYTVNINTEVPTKMSFAYFKFPPTGYTTAYLVLQKRSTFGLKKIFMKAFQDFLLKSGDTQSRIELANLTLGRVYREMHHLGKLNKVNLITKRIPDDIASDFNKLEVHVTSGKKVVQYSKRGGLGEAYKKFVDCYMKLKYPNKSVVQIIDSDENVDEIEFELELNGKKKTFFVVNRDRTQPDIDITDNVIFDDRTGLVREEDLLSEARSIVHDIVTI